MFEHTLSNDQSHQPSSASTNESWASRAASSIWGDIKGVGRVAGDVAKGVVHEAETHPVQLVEHVIGTAVVGAVTGAVAGATGVGLGATLAIGAVGVAAYGLYRGEEIARHEGFGAIPAHMTAAVTEGSNFSQNVLHKIQDDAQAVKTRFNGAGTAAEQEAAAKKVQGVAGTGLEIGSYVAGGVLGAEAAPFVGAAASSIRSSITGMVGREAAAAPVDALADTSAATVKKVAEKTLMPVAVAKGTANQTFQHLLQTTPMDHVISAGTAASGNAANTIRDAAHVAISSTSDAGSTSTRASLAAAAVVAFANKESHSNSSVHESDAHRGQSRQFAERSAVAPDAQTSEITTDKTEALFNSLKDSKGYWVIDFKNGTQAI